MKTALKVLMVIFSSSAVTAGVIAAISVCKSKSRKKYITICD